MKMLLTLMLYSTVTLSTEYIFVAPNQGGQMVITSDSIYWIPPDSQDQILKIVGEPRDFPVIYWEGPRDTYYEVLVEYKINGLWLKQNTIEYFCDLPISQDCSVVSSIMPNYEQRWYVKNLDDINIVGPQYKL